MRRSLRVRYLRWTKRRWTGEITTGTLSEAGSEDDELNNVDVHEAVIAALKVLPPKQRAIVVLRYFADLTEAQTAAAMGCRVGTVKSQTARALSALREVPGLDEVLTEGLAP